MEVSGQLHVPAASPPGKNPWYPLDRRLGRPQSGLDTVVKKNIPSPPAVTRTPDHPARSPALYHFKGNLKSQKFNVLESRDNLSGTVLRFSCLQFNAASKNTLPCISDIIITLLIL